MIGDYSPDMLKGLLTRCWQDRERFFEGCCCMTTTPSRLGRFAPSLIALMLGCTALSAPAHAGWLFGGDDDSAKTPAAKTAEAPKDPASTKPVPAADIEGNVRQAQMLRLAGNYDEAIHHLSQLMLVASDDARVVGEYGKTMAQMGRAQDAVQFLTRAQQLNGTDWTIYSALGVAYDEIGAQVQAQSAYQRALSLKPGEASVLNNYALSRLLAHDPQTARRLAAEARASGGDADPKIRRNLAMIDEMAPAQKGADEKAPEDKAPEKSSIVPPQPTVAETERPAPAPAPAPAKASASSAPVPVKATAGAAPTPAKPEIAKATAPVSTPHAVSVSALPPASAPVATAAPRPITPHVQDSAIAAAHPAAPAPRGVVMQKVPVDPLAGPVAHKAAQDPHAVAVAQPAKEMPKAETARTETPKPQLAKAEKPGPAKPAPVKPQVAKAQAARSAKPETQKPEVAKPQLARMEAPKPAPAKSQGSRMAEASEKNSDKVADKIAGKPDAKAKINDKNAVPALRLSANAY